MPINQISEPKGTMSPTSTRELGRRCCGLTSSRPNSMRVERHETARDFGQVALQEIVDGWRSGTR